MNMWQRTAVSSIFVGALAFASGCDRQQADTAAKKVDRSAETAGKKIDSAVDTAGQKLDRAGSEVAAATKDAAAKTANAVDDAAITAKVKAALFAEPGLKTLQIEVDTRGGTVTLAGSVDSETLRKRAVEIAGSLNGVAQVVDKLVVKS